MPLHSIASVERDTGLGKDTLRVWERRYGFPTPARDAYGERLYSSAQVSKLRTIKRLMEQGIRPGKIMLCSDAELAQLAQTHAQCQSTVQSSPHQAELDRFLSLCQSRQPEALRRALRDAMERHGLQNFVMEIIAPLTTMVGHAWAQGSLTVFDEHLYTEAVQTCLRSAIATLNLGLESQHHQPCVLLTTVPTESHGLGLLMAEALLTLAGARCISLGVETPIPDIAAAASKHGADIIGLSFSAQFRSSDMQTAIDDLRALVPPTMHIWVGGQVQYPKRPSNSAYLRLDLAELSAEVGLWRQRRRQTASN